MSYDVGDLVRFGNPVEDTDAEPFRNLAGVPTNPTSVTMIILKPDGTRLVFGWPVPGADGELTNASAGRFHYDVVIDQGDAQWRHRIAGTGDVTAASEGSIRVRPQRVT